MPTALSKVADERWQSAADLARQLRWIEASRTVEDPQPAFRPARRGTIAWLAVAAAAAVAAISIAYFVTERQQAGTRLTYRFEIPPPPGTSYEGPFSISPDGRRLAFTTTDVAGLRSLWIRAVDGLTARRIESADGARYPFWSPDGASLGFFADRKLKVVDLGTGNVRILTDTGSGGGGTWNADGVILFADESTATMRPAVGRAEARICVRWRRRSRDAIRVREGQPRYSSIPTLSPRWPPLSVHAAGGERARRLCRSTRC